MKFPELLVISLLSVLVQAFDDAHLASKAKADQAERKRCGYNLIKLWTAEVAHSPFAAPPLIADVNGDGRLDIVAAPLSEAQTVIEAESGKTLTDSKWPAQKLDTSILSSPLQYDIDGDGMLDILFVTHSGELQFYTASGTVIRDKFLELPPAYVQQDWFQKVVSASSADVGKYVQAGRDTVKGGYLPVDAHVMATPIIADLNNDARLEELVIPVSYFFDDEDYRLPENFNHINNINRTELGKYVVSGITVVNLTDMTITHTIFLDLTTKMSGFPAYVLYSPTVIDMDRNGGPLEIVIGTSAGNVHVVELDARVKDRQGFPYSMGIIHGQLTVEDINKDGTLEIIAIDTSGNVICLNDDGTLAWEAEITGDSSPGSRLLDVDNDGYVDVIIPTNEGDVFALSGVTGKILDKWPIRTGHPILSNVIATKISSTRKDLDLIFLTNDGALHVISTDQTCQTHYPIGETSLVQVLSHDLVVQSEGLELLISTNDGTLICMGSGEDTEELQGDDIYRRIHTLSLPSETKTPNDFLFSDKKFGIFVHESSRNRVEVTGGMFHVEFNIDDPGFVQTSQKSFIYSLKVYFGSHLLYKDTYTSPGAYSIFVESYMKPSHGHIILVLTNKSGKIAQDSFPVKFNQIILEDLQWLLMAPFVTMVIILLVIHGFPAKDLLPVTFQSKER